MVSINSRLARLEQVRDDGHPSLIVYEADEELSWSDETAWAKAAVGDLSLLALIICLPRNDPTGEPPRLLQVGGSGMAHEDALAYLG